jgi:ubiquinone/menaquinone biosynthesis C-methylase UbiE
MPEDRSRRSRRRAFDLWSLFYDAPLVQRFTYRPAQDAVLRSLRHADLQRVLDVGCGTGQLTARLRSELPDAVVVGCDFSRGMLARAAERSPDVGWVQGDAGRLPFADASFDAVCCTEAFHWFPDPERALAEFLRVLAPGGRLRLEVINPPVELLSELTRVGSRLGGQPLYWPTRARLRTWLRRAGFRVESQRAVFRLPASVLLPAVLTSARREGDQLSTPASRNPSISSPE